jgi:hypothetical protein
MNDLSFVKKDERCGRRVPYDGHAAKAKPLRLGPSQVDEEWSNSSFSRAFLLFVNANVLQAPLYVDRHRRAVKRNGM